MIAIAVDDENWALKELEYNLQREDAIDSVHAFDQSSSAIEWAEGHAFDVAFLDINMRGIDGLELAKKLREFNPKCYIVFCTGYGDYALDAFGLHVNAYLLKPILPEKLHEEIKYLLALQGKGDKRIKVRCYGGFEVYDMQDNVLHFKRTRSKELLAILIDSNGMGLNSHEISQRLFGIDEKETSDSKNMNHLYKLVQELKRVLATVGAENVLKNTGGDYFVDMSLIEQDNRGKGEVEYMAQYHWN